MHKRKMFCLLPAVMLVVGLTCSSSHAEDMNVMKTLPLQEKNVDAMNSDAKNNMMKSFSLPRPNYEKMAEILSENPDFLRAWEDVMNKRKLAMTPETTPPASEGKAGDNDWRSLFQLSENEEATQPKVAANPVNSHAEVFLTFNCGYCRDFLRDYLKNKEINPLLRENVSIRLLPESENEARAVYVFNRLKKKNLSLAENFLSRLYNDINNALRGSKRENILYMDQWLQKNVGQSFSQFMQDMQESERDELLATMKDFEGYGASHIPLLVVDGKVIEAADKNADR